MILGGAGLCNNIGMGRGQGYGCECEAGFVLADDGLSCEPIEFCDDDANQESVKCTKSSVAKAGGCGGCVSIQGTGMEMLLLGWLLTLRRRRK